MRVGCILYIDEEEKTVFFLGYGDFIGYEIPDENAGGLAEICRVRGQANPKMVLDNGKTVWGCECWWAEEDETRAQLRDAKRDGFKIEIVDIDEFRKG
jgi:hypothetical protein